MTLDVAVKVPPSPGPDAPLDAVALVLLHHDDHFRLLERSLRDFQRLERQLQQESGSKTSATLPAITAAIEAYCDVKPSFYPPEQQAARLAIALEDYLRELAANSQLLASSLALKSFLHGNVLSTHATMGPSYRDAVDAAIEAGDEEKAELMQERVAAGCSVEHQVTVSAAGDGDKQLVLWKFASQGTGLVFSAQFSSGEEGESGEVDPYSVSSNDAGSGVQGEEGEMEVVHYRTDCDFSADEGDESVVYGHFVTDKAGILTLQWENVDMSSIVSKPLKFQAKVVPLKAAVKVLEVAGGLNAVDTSEWLRHHVSASGITVVEDLMGWERVESEGGFGDSSYDDNLAGEGPEKDSQIQSAVLEERILELEAQVTRLEENLVDTKKELKSALDRVQIAEEIYKANLETITQLECASSVPKASRTTGNTEDTSAPPAATPSTQPEGTPSSELERVQRLCAGFQEQCLWRSVENMELEAQLAASQVEAASWREKHADEAAQLKALELQNRTLRTHKKMLVQEVKRLQPYSQVNLAALVQEAQEARMVQRSLQAKLDSHEQLGAAAAGSAGDTGPADFVLVEAAQGEP
ncbi:Phox homologous domain [Phytophthora cinnamomi]|uniref:Phox homologous domain n=1 Tax=Phytophthora cinnamomi TaxID=4785 RepID=UPI003559ECB3|nr:Phox homologous domain [Phytophthora cinnamomi]